MIRATAGTGPPADGHVWVTPTRFPEPPNPAAAGVCAPCVRRGGSRPAPLFLPPGAAEVSGVKGSPQGCRAQRDAQHPWGRRGGPVACAARLRDERRRSRLLLGLLAPVQASVNSADSQWECLVP